MSLYNIINLNVTTATQTQPFFISPVSTKSFSIVNLIIASNLVNSTTGNTIAINFGTQINGTGFKLIISSASQTCTYAASLILTSGTNSTPIVFNPAIPSPNSITYGDYLYITYNNNQWNYISSSTNLIKNELSFLGASAPSSSNPLLTRDSLKPENGGITKLQTALAPYTDGKTLTGDNRLVTTLNLSRDLYKLLDVSFTDKLGAIPTNNLGTSADSNKLESTESINYLNQFLLVMQNNPTFYQAVANEVVIQNSLNEINVPVNTLITLTYPAIINKSKYFGDIIIQSNNNNDGTITYSPINELVLNLNTSLIYLGSNIDVQTTTSASKFKLKYYTTRKNGTNTVEELYNNTMITLTLPSIAAPTDAVSVTFLVVNYNSPHDTISNINGVFLYNGENAIVQNTVTSLYQSPNSTYAAITYTYTSPIISPLSLCIINPDNQILYNSNNLIYINSSPPTPLTTIPSNIYPNATITYSTFNNLNQVYYNGQNLQLTQSINNITFYLNGNTTLILNSIVLGYEDNSLITKIDFTSVNLANNSITVFYEDTINNNAMSTHILYLYFYSNETWYKVANTIYINNSTPPSPIPEVPDGNGCYIYTMSTILTPNALPTPPPTPLPSTTYSVDTNTIVTFNVSTCDISMTGNYIFELGYLVESVFTAIPSNIITTSDLNTVSVVLYDYSNLPPLAANAYYTMCVSIRIPPFEKSNNYILTNSILLIVQTPTPPAPPIPPALPTPSNSLISILAQNSVSSANFPAMGTLQNPYSVIQGNTISFFIYSTTSFIESIIYFNGYELTYYTQASDPSNTYFGGSKSYVNTMQLSTPFTQGGYTYNYYTAISIKMTLPINAYYVTVSNKFLSESGQETLLYSLNNIYLNIAEQTNLVIQGSLVNGIIVPPLISSPETGSDIGSYATVNGHILLPNKSLYAYKTKINDVPVSGYFYVITSNTIANDSDASDVLSGNSQTGLICFEGQGNGILLNQTTKAYNAIINNMLLYFQRMAYSFGYELSSKIASILDTKLENVGNNIDNVIKNIEYTARNIFLCGMYTTNIYINGNSLPTGTSYYPNGVTYQGPNTTTPPIPLIPQSPEPPADPLATAPNPDVNGAGNANGIFYLAANIPTPPPAIGTPGQYWGVNIKNCSTGQLTLQQPTNWTTTANLPSGLTTTSDPPTIAGDFRGVNSFNALNNLFEGDTGAYKIQYSCKNVIIIPSNYIGYGIIDSPTTQEPPYILSIILNTTTQSAQNDNCPCNQMPSQLNGNIIANGTEIMIINNSAMNIRIVSFNTTSSTPIQINLKDTTMDSLYIKPAESMHLVFGGETWGIM